MRAPRRASRPDELQELRVERPVHGGLCVARPIDAPLGDDVPRGPLVLLAGAVPGERVRARVAVRKGVAFGETLEVLEASADRVPAPAHPGLDLGHLTLARQLAWKHEVLLDAARRAGVDLPGDTPPVVPSPAAWGYRGAIQPAVVRTPSEAGEALGGEGGDLPATRLGYRRPGAHELVELDADPTANPACVAAWDALRAQRLPRGVIELAIRGNDDGEALVALIATGAPRDALDAAHALVRAGVAGVALAPHDPRGRFRGGAQRLAGARSLVQRFGEAAITVTAASFGQPNAAAAGALFRELAGWAPAARHALDLYGGNGVIGLHLAAKAEQVTVIDVDRGAIERGRADAARAGVTHVRHVRLDARELLVPPDVDLIAVDPPRAGLAGATRAALVESRTRTLLYVSCDVATWARDVADLQRSGFRLERVRPYDFQPHTHHLEILSLLRR